MKIKPKSKDFTAQVGPNGLVKVTQGRKLVALIAPEIFTEGWAKRSLTARPQGAHGIIPIPGQGWVALQTTVKPVKSGIRLRFTLTPLETVKVIHLRLVMNLPYNDWLNSRYQLGRKAGRIPTKKPANIRLAEAQSTPLTLGPSPLHDGLTLGLKAPKLYTVLQDNRQWTPYLQAFVNRHEPNDPAWEWRQKKVFAFTLSSQ
jgi:hypothetical protein